jgi:hypothetical protein
MTDQPILQQILDVVQGHCNELAAVLAFREAREVDDLTMESGVHPALHWSCDGDGQNRENNTDGEDSRGYTLDFPLYFKITASGGRKGELGKEVRRLVAVLQEKIEADPTLDDKALWVEYVRNDYFLHDGGAVGGAIVTYQVTYRRERGRPDVGY